MGLARVFRTDQSISSLILRLTLALVMFPHGAQKLLGWFGGPGFKGTMGFFTGQMHVPGPLAFLVIMAESLGAIGIALGAGTRIAAAGICAVMLGAVQMVHLRNGFFMNWSGAQPGEGFEFHLLVMGISLALIVVGAGRFSVDHWLAERLAKHEAEDDLGHPTGVPARRGT